MSNLHVPFLLQSFCVGFYCICKQFWMLTFCQSRKAHLKFDCFVFKQFNAFVQKYWLDSNFSKRDHYSFFGISCTISFAPSSVCTLTILRSVQEIVFIIDISIPTNWSSTRTTWRLDDHLDLQVQVHMQHKMRYVITFHSSIKGAHNALTTIEHIQSNSFDIISNYMIDWLILFI